MVVVVIGGGPAGVMAAGVAACGGHEVILLERMEKPLRKLRISGKGRCNVTNMKSMPEFLEKINRGAAFAEGALSDFDNSAVCRFFEGEGLSMSLERGDRVFPSSGKAWDVAETMLAWAVRCGVEIRCHSGAESVVTSPDGDGRVIGVRLSRGDTIHCQRVILSTGGVSYPATGSTGDGHQMAWELGHEIVPLRPALVPLEVRCMVHEVVVLKNIELSVLIDGQCVTSRFGEMEFTKVPGIVSGATVLQVSSTVVDAIADNCARVSLMVDLKSALSVEKLTARIERLVAELPRATVKVLLGKLTVSALHAQVAAGAEISTKWPVEQLTPAHYRLLARALKEVELPVIDYRPFTEAIVTAGGVSLDQVDPATMQSRITAGLYFAGELLDIDADTGGFNIQLALSTGRRAGRLL